jgi:hypothetical protein
MSEGSVAASPDHANDLDKFAFYYPWPPIDGRPLSGWIKNMLLFFDGVALLAPREARSRAIDDQRETALPLLDSGRLRLLDPQDLIDDRAAKRLLDFLRLTTVGDYDDHFGWSKGTDLERTLASELGLLYRGRQVVDYRDERIADSAKMLWRDLRRRGLISEPLPDHSIYANRDFWAVYQALLTHVVRPAGVPLGLDLQPVTDDVRLARSLGAILGIQRRPSAGRVVQFDFDTVGLDLTDVPLKDVLEFKTAHGAQFRRYSADVRLFTYELAQLAADQREVAFAERQDELADAAADLRRLSRRWWRRPLASIALGSVGATWYGVHGVWDDAVMSLLAGLIGAGGRPSFDNVFCYVFTARDRLGDAQS